MQKPDQKIKATQDYKTKGSYPENIKLRIEHALVKKLFNERLNAARGIVWAILLSVPLWLVLGFFLIKFLE